ncbi:uncharacterized protein BDR25DRAFT_295558 [Lindgomyces ingoldianus]|uniref:Uncharacterized protein n=1 Tax=Lindgomyces ingoldianus TaxID=673940 RepID=A0ACB6QFJ9_9PLEO|nr:uncharacterized protein BDR25DRAFT_295558 [Lindgomyces ingoldianus]KAF2465132.1 hypothetical protein BDR25DRAFT_295558 [Lindgomyces ingoldianus]
MENVDIHTTPALVPPPGITPNLQNPYSLERYIIATSVICLFLATSATLARTFTKAYILKKMQLEDYSLIFSTSGFAAFTAVIVAAGEDGAGRHQWNVSIAMTQRIGMYANVVEILYPPLMFAAKFAVLVQIQRIFTAHKKDFIYWSVLVLIAANIVMYATIFFVFIFACNPREKIWMPHLAGKCLSVNAAIIATGVMNLVSDCTILALPLMGISELQMPLKKKIGAGAVFATGVL